MRLLCPFMIVFFLNCHESRFMTRKLQGFDVKNTYDPGSCKPDNEGESVIVKDRQENDKVLICLKHENKYKWEALDGSVPAGEYFNPAFDCSDIIDKERNPENGLYWVNFGSAKPRQVWCDLKIDGGGYILIGRKNNSITWSVPSNDKLVTPDGDPHWSSNFGDIPILDFRIQISTSPEFKDTAAHWSYRLQRKRPLGNLMVLDEGGCDHFPGIGHVAHVKDILTEKIVSSKFRCSRFGGYYHASSGLGWAMMNSCLKKPCTWGFAYHHSFPYQIDYSGAYSYNTLYSVSGILHNATAFIGCDKGLCCGCFGPKGGRKEYCAPKCQAINGGKTAKNVYTWFWVRSNLPKKVWKKCMEFSEVNENGKEVNYVIDETGVKKEGNCGNEFTLNDGVVVVPNNSSTADVPPVSGLLSYHSDNKKLYVHGEKEWKPLVEESKLNEIIEEQSEKLSNLSKELDERLYQLNKTVYEEIVLVEDINTQECNSYTRLTSSDRSISYTYQGNTQCDSNINKAWYRFGAGAGSKMSTACPPMDRCSTDVTTWLSGDHPDVNSGIVDRDVCFHWNNNCCLWTHRIRVRNCGTFYVYEFSPSTNGYCHYRYCATS